MDRAGPITQQAKAFDMKYNIVTFGKKPENLKAAIESKTIGSFMSTFERHISKGAQVFLHCNGKIWGKAKVCSEYFFDQTDIWQDKVYPHRYKITDIKLTSDPIELVNGYYNTSLRADYGTGWAYKFLFSPKPLPDQIGSEIDSDLANRSNVDLNSLEHALSL